ncbi:hypothetical protein DPMN_136409 [Dreissena polymorpha]|uniref:Uncharacterized protein n=1 Tax=Dreissena polymorpha TaxID=45954 RepID=A0A9D4FZT0_DREPO|nr:hypothetical protein DPMN_136409 [Dreissena polymorpha]
MATGSQSLIVAAFDFGTTYSGYAYSFKDSPNDVIANKSWTAGSGKLISLKTPTRLVYEDIHETSGGRSVVLVDYQGRSQSESESWAIHIVCQM